jgi:hypothetical protein
VVALGSIKNVVPDPKVPPPVLEKIGAATDKSSLE